MALRSQLEDVHAALLQELAGLEKVTTAPAPDGALLAAARLRLSKASTRRLQLLDQKILPAVLDKVSRSEAQALVELRNGLSAARARSSEHVIRWPLEQAKQDWAGYCAASAQMRKDMRAQIERERTVIGPLLRKMGE